MSMAHGNQCGQGSRIVKCPACKKEVPFAGNPYRPFCSRGCKGLDLIHWAGGNYCIEGKTEEEKDDHTD